MPLDRWVVPMAVEFVDVAVSDLLLDEKNARFKDQQETQQATALALAEQQGDRLLNLAEDIVESGLDPLARPAIVPTDDRRRRYVVIEGNRRVLALKALDTPALISPALSSSQHKRLNALSERYANSPIDTVSCALFTSDDEIRHWMELRHTGQNEGVGLVEWGADEKDRFGARHGTRSAAGQILDFVEKRDLLSQEAKESSIGVLTSVRRLIGTPAVREAIGLEVTQGQVYSRYPGPEVAKPLSYIVEQMKTREIHVGDIYTAEQRRAYAESIPAEYRPDERTRLDQPIALHTVESAQPEPAPRKKGRRRKSPAERTAIIPRDCDLDIDTPRINYLYSELSSLSVDSYPNVCSVALRVFLELSVDAYVSRNALLSEDQIRNKPLAKRLKEVASHLSAQGEIDQRLKVAMDRVADSSQLLSPSAITFNQYVHNYYVHPTASELRAAWDELQPLFEKVWSSE